MLEMEYYRSRSRISYAGPNLLANQWTLCFDHDPMRYAAILVSHPTSAILYSLWEGAPPLVHFRVAPNAASVVLLREQLGDYLMQPIQAVTTDTQAYANVISISYDPGLWAEREAIIHEYLSH